MKQCVKCNKEVFVATISVPAQFRIGDNGEIDIIGLDIPNLEITSDLTCECGHVCTKDQLFSKACDRCGEMFSQEFINENGLCATCQSLVDRFSNMTPDDMINYILKLEQEKLQAKKPAARKKVSKAKKEEEAPAVEENAVAEPTTVEIAQDPEPTAENNEPVNPLAEIIPIEQPVPFVEGNTDLLKGVDFSKSVASEEDQVEESNDAADLIPTGQQEIPVQQQPIDFGNIFPQQTSTSAGMSFGIPQATPQPIPQNSDGFDVVDLNTIGGNEFPL